MKKLAKASVILKKITLVLGLVVFVGTTIFSLSFPAGEGGWAGLVMTPAFITLFPAFFCFDYSDFHLKNNKKILGNFLFILGSLFLILFILLYSLIFTH